jgi:16S rRNA (adenine1518-N6/adenine1519-N6)-dimethyltransferase
MTSPQTLLKAWDLRARKELGQNFLIDPGTARRIVGHAGIEPDDVVLDIGAGFGAMTIAAARQAHKVIAVEKDRHLVPLLRAELLQHELSHVEIHEGDILKVDLSALAGAGSKPLVVLGNLPYNVSSQIVVRLIEARQHVDRAILMFQKELADRLCAGPGSKTYGRLSVILQYCAHLTPLMQIGASQFHPRPKVDSAVLKIAFKPHIDHPVRDERLFTRVVQAAFGQRRKNLRNALSSGLLPLDRPEVERLLDAADIDHRRRAETLSVEAFVMLTNLISAHLVDSGDEIP